MPGADVHAVIQVHRRHLLAVMQRYTKLKAEAAEDDVALALIVDAELFRLEAAVHWLDAAETRFGRVHAKVATSSAPNVSRRKSAAGRLGARS